MHATASDPNSSLMTIKPAAITALGGYCNAWKSVNLASNLIPGVLRNVPILTLQCGYSAALDISLIDSVTGFPEGTRLHPFELVSSGIDL